MTPPTYNTTTDDVPSADPQSGDKLAMDLVNQMQTMFGKHHGYRTTHAKGLLVEGVFTPTEEAKKLSIAPHFNKTATPVTARFSVGGGIPYVSDTDNGATPKGLAIRFQINSDIHTDLISHSFNGFAARTGEEFLAFLKVFFNFRVAQSKPKDSDESIKSIAAFRAFLASHPAAAAFVSSPKPNPVNYGTITYYEPNTHVLTNQDNKATNVRYRLIPADGDHLYSDDQLKNLSQNYLEEDLQERFPVKPIVFTIQAHIADPDDVLDDATIPFKSTKFIAVGNLEINRVADDNSAKQQQIAFSSSPEKGGVNGIVSSADPLIRSRNDVYDISSTQRRSETQVE